MTNLEKELERLRYQIKLIGETLDFNRDPITSLVIEMNWDHEDLDAAHDIFEKYDNKLEKNEDFNWQLFEFELRDKFQIGYQTVKDIILSFYRNHQWVRVCKGYAKAFECSEFHEIIRTDT